MQVCNYELQKKKRTMERSNFVRMNNKREKRKMEFCKAELQKEQLYGKTEVIA